MGPVGDFLETTKNVETSEPSSRNRPVCASSQWIFVRIRANARRSDFSLLAPQDPSAVS